METRLKAEDERCQFCRKFSNDCENGVWDNEVLVSGVQVIRFFSCIPCKQKMFRLLKQWS